MIISKVEVARLDLQLKKPYTIAYETISKATNFILKLTTSDGLQGYGCAAPDLPITGETPDMVRAAISKVVIPILKGNNSGYKGELMEQLRKSIPDHKSTLAMVDNALYDLLSRKAGLPLYQFLGGYRKSIPTSVTIGISSVEETLLDAEEIVANEFFILKIKGGLNIEQDIERIRKLREKYRETIQIRFDGNQGYSSKDTERFVKGVEQYNIEVLEQPMKIGAEVHPTWDGASIPIMADESLKHLKDAFRIAKNETIDMINIKIQKVGGIEEALHINSVSKAANNEVMVGCMDECALGISAGLHFALSRPNVQYADLDAHLDFINDPFNDLFYIKKGIMHPSEHAGLGKIDQSIDKLFN